MGNPHRDKARRQRRGGGDYSNDSMSDAFQRRYGSIDVSVDGVAPSRRDTRNDRPQRPKLEFREVHALEQRDCRCKITAAEGVRGTIYNFTVERAGRDRPSRFFRDGDAADLAALVIKAAEWIDAQKSGDAGRDTR